VRFVVRVSQTLRTELRKQRKRFGGWLGVGLDSP